MAIMYIPIENCICLKEKINLYLSVLKQFTLSKTVLNQISTLVNSIDPDQLASEEASRSGSTLFQCKM